MEWIEMWYFGDAIVSWYCFSADISSELLHVCSKVLYNTDEWVTALILPKELLSDSLYM